MAIKLFADTNVYLDFLMQRGNDWTYSQSIFELAEKGEISVYTSSSSLVNIMYVMSTYKLDRKDIIGAMYAILSYTKIVNPDNITFEIALASLFKDLEDAVQYYTALEVGGINYFVTSNIKDYKAIGPLLPVLTPRQFCENYEDLQ